MIIALLTDFGLSDHFVGVVKAVILGISPNVKIVDISHSISPGDILQAAFLLKSSYRYFPRGTTHLVVVDPGVGSKRKAIIVKTENYYFIGPDNGVLSAALETEKIINKVCITNQRFFLKPVSFTFHARDIFAPVAAYLSRGRNINEFGVPQKAYKRLMLPKPNIKGKALLGEIIHIDRFGNLITNIKEDDFRRFTANRHFRISLRGKTIHGLSRSYLQTQKNKPLAIFGSFGNLEISASCASAEDYFGAKKGQRVGVFLI